MSINLTSYRWSPNERPTLESEKKDLNTPVPQASDPTYADQPVVAVYVPERDGVANPKTVMHLNGAIVNYRQWDQSAAFEGSQQMLAHQLGKVEKLLDQQEEENKSEKIYDDYSLFIVGKDTDPQLYKTLGEVPERTAVLLEHPLHEYPVQAIDAMESHFGRERMYTSVESAVKGIQSALGLTA